MTVSAGVGGGSVVGVVLGGGAVTANGMAAPSPARVVGTLPFTGATHVMELVALAVVMLIVGVLAVGLSRRANDELPGES